MFRFYGARKEGFLLEFNGATVFGLDLFIISLFLSSEQFVLYFFIQRIFGSLNVMHGLVTRNFWSQSLLGGRDVVLQVLRTNHQYLFSVAILGGSITIALILAFYLIGYFQFEFFSWSFLPGILVSEKFLVWVSILSGAIFVLTGINRHQKIHFPFIIAYWS